MLLRVFINFESHHPLSEYADGKFPSNQLQIYTWLNADLLELTSLIKEMKPEAAKTRTAFKFAVIYADRSSPRFYINHLGSTVVGYRGPDDFKMLKDTRFNHGDYLSVCIEMPKNKYRSNDLSNLDRKHSKIPKHDGNNGNSSGDRHRNQRYYSR